MSQKIHVDELDFDTIKSNIKTFLSTQTTLKDYNFEGSALSVLLDVLAYNTHYNSLYTNFVANELFLDSASKYSSAVSLAKAIGYTPRSYTSAEAIINVTVTLPDDETPAIYILPKGTAFVSPLGNTQYIFLTETDHTAIRDINGNYIFENVHLKEGQQKNRTYTTATGTQFVIPHLNADIKSLKVSVRDSGSSSVINTYTYAQDLLKVKALDKVFFVKQREDLFYEIYFGNDILGKAVQNGNVVSLDYLISSGSAANGLTKYTYFGGNRADIFYDISLVSESFGGAEVESLNSIKFNAPKAYTAQNRAVTVSDYETVIYNQFASVQSVKVWGGQDNIPKQYGKVFICAKPFARDYLNSDEKTAILDVLESRKIMTMIPTFVDPDFLKLELSSSVYYNQHISSRTPGELRTRVLSSIVEYANSLNAFNSSFRYSSLSRVIDSCDSSVISNIINFRVRSPVLPLYNTAASYIKNFGNPIHQKSSGGSFFSSKFFENNSLLKNYLVDNGAGTIVLMKETDSGISTPVRTVGSIDYSAGSVNISNLNITGLYDSGELEFVFYSNSNDIIPSRQYIVSIPTESLSVTVIPDSLAAGDNQANSNHIFTPSR